MRYGRTVGACVALIFAAGGLTLGAEQAVVAFARLKPDALQTRDARSELVTTAAGPRLRLATGHKSPWPAVLVHAEKPWTLAAYQYVTVTVKNVGQASANVGLRLDSEGADRRQPGPQSRVDLKPGAERTIVVRLSQPVPQQWKDKLFAMRGLPFGWSEKGAFDPARVNDMSVYVTKPTEDHRLEISDIRATGTAPHVSPAVVERLLPMIDKYGQFMHADWPGKVHSDADLARCRTEEAAEWAARPGPTDWDRFGGWRTGPQLPATGFFRAEKQAGRWWLVDPEGRLFWSHGIDCVRPSANAPLTERESYFAELPPRNSPFGAFYSRITVSQVGYYAGRRVETFSFQTANLLRKYGPDWEQQFATVAHRRLRSWALNTIGNWSDPKVYLQHKTAYVVPIHHQGKSLEGSKGYWGKFWDVFDASFRSGLDRSMAKEQGATAGDPWCIGYFIDNELGWGDELSLALATLASPPGQAAKRVFLADLQAKYKTIDALNAAWGSKHSSWESLRDSQTPPDAKRARADLTAFAVKFNETYFRTCRDAVKAVAPQQLYLGCRFAWVNPLAVHAAARYCDVITYNLYRDTIDDFRPPEGVDKPVLVGEFHFGALDRGMFHTGLRPVESQAARAQAYQNYVSGALRNPCLVGTHWFQYADEPTTGRFDGENYQIGFIDGCDTPYPETVAASRQVGARLYTLRAQGK